MPKKSEEYVVEYSDEFNSLSQFLDEVFQMDQSDPQRSKAPECLKMLLAREKKFFGTPLEKFFWNSVSLESFHIAQSMAVNGDLTDVKSYLTQALESAKKAFSSEWLAYVKGTKCYFDGDIHGLQKEISNSDSEDYRKVLERLLNGYKNRGSIDYNKDYSGTAD